MRTDFHKVMNSAGRTKAPRSSRFTVPMVDGEALCNPRISMRETSRSDWRYKVKRLRTAPLYRFLTSRAGRRWDEVYSELRSMLRGPRSHEMLSQVQSLVVTTTQMGEGGEVVYGAKYGGVQEARTEDFYVHPITGILTRGHSVNGNYHYERPLTWQQRRELELLKVRRELDETTQAHCIDGIWYQVGLAPIPPLRWLFISEEYGSIPGVETDVLLGNFVPGRLRRTLYEKYGREGVYGAQKRQMSHRELKQHGLLSQ